MKPSSSSSKNAALPQAEQVSLTQTQAEAVPQEKKRSLIGNGRELVTVKTRHGCFGLVRLRFRDDNGAEVRVVDTTVSEPLRSRVLSWVNRLPFGDVSRLLEQMSGQKVWGEDGVWRLVHLEAAHLEAAHLEAAHLEAAHLEAAHLEAAHLEAAHLEAAHLEAAHLEAAHLEAAHLEAAHLEAAHLEAAHLEAAHLEAAHLEAAHLEAAHLEAAHLEAAHLEAAHLEAAQKQRVEESAPLSEPTYLAAADRSSAIDRRAKA